MIFYTTDAGRKIATHNDIIPDAIFYSFKEAESSVLKYGGSGDVVFAQVNGEWVIVWGYNDQDCLLVSKEYEGWSNAVPIDQFIERQFNEGISHPLGV